MNTLETDILQSYPIFTKLDPADLKKILESITIHKTGSNKLCFSKDECQGFTLVLDGVLRVQYMSDNGRELTIYRLGRGDYCHLTIVRLLYGREINYEVYSEKPMKLAIIPKQIFELYLSNNPIFLKDIYKDLHDKMDALYKVINNIGFESVENRLIAYFKGKQKLTGSNIFNMTHEQIGIEIGTTRETVTRLLSRMQEEGSVKLSRKKVEWLG